MTEAVAAWIVEAGIASGTTATVLAYGTVIVASVVVTQALVSQQLGGSMGANGGYGAAQQNPGSRTQLPPAGSNKLPVVYGSAYVGGIITDLSITNDNQNLYYVIALSEVTNTQDGGSPDEISFGNIYWGGKKCVMTGSSVVSLLDESTGIYDTSVNGKLSIYLYKNGSYNGWNTSDSAIDVMQGTGLSYQWDDNKLMSNCAFAIVKLTYSQTANLTGLAQTRFQVINSRTNIGDCIFDYMTSSRYGAAIASDKVNLASIDALNVYGNEIITYTNSSGISSTQARFKFDGVIDTTQTIMQNLQTMSTSCDCLIRYNEIESTWGVVVQSPSASIVMDLNDSNMVSSISVSPIDISNTYNIVECKYPDGSAKDSFSTATFDLAVLDPDLMFNNEPVNKQSINLNLVNNDVRVQILANRFLKAAREDLQIQCQINYSGIQLEAGDIVTVTNSNYGWTAKPFRVIKVTEVFGSDGNITATLSLSEYNATVYSDADVTEFTPAPNTGIGDPTFFGTVPAPTVTGSQPNITNPSFGVVVTSSSSGITQYAEVWYSAFASPTPDQLIFAGTTAIQSSGNPYNTNAVLPTVTLANIPSGNWYFFTRMVNSLASSIYSPASTLFQWRPTTFQYTERYLCVAYADDIAGTGFTFDPRGKSYYGLLNNDSGTPSVTASDYTWYLAQPTFGTVYYLLYTNRTGRKFSFATGTADYASGTGIFVPTQTGTYDPSIWQAVIDGTNTIDLDARTGQLIRTGTTSVSSGQIAVTNNSDGLVVASLQQFLDFGAGVTTLTGSASTLTIDIYGRVLGFTSPDGFYFTIDNFTATAGQTVFTPVARQVGYIVGQDLVFRNGSLIDTADYSETGIEVTMNNACVVGEQVVILSFRSASSGNYYEYLNIAVSSVAGSVVTYDASTLPYQIINAGDTITFANTGSPTQYTVLSVNSATREITMTTTVTGVTAGDLAYRYRVNGSSYPAFSRYTTTLSSAGSYTPTTWAVNSGFEMLFLNGSSFNEQDYDIVGGQINNFPAAASGFFTIIQFAPNNLGVPASGVANTVTNSVNGTATYAFSYTAEAFDLFYNGALLTQGTDYTTASGSYTLTQTPTNSTQILQQQTFNRTGAA